MGLFDRKSQPLKRRLLLIIRSFYVSWILALCIGCVIVIEAQDAIQPPGSSKLCPLSDSQQQAASKAFAVMTPTFQTPRCINCHGVVNPYTGKNHGGGQIAPTVVEERVEHVDNGLEPPHDVVHPSFKVYDCSNCHVHGSRTSGAGWRIPDRSFSFVAKDSVQLCRQMKEMIADAQGFMDHIAKDATLDTPFIQIAFGGTRDLNDYGQTTYEENYYKKGIDKTFQAEPPPITHATFTSQAQAWVDAMGGKFRGDSDCGCVPHHYTLSVDMKSIADYHAGDSISHTEMSGHAEIPLEFKDDGSFEKETQFSWNTSSLLHLRRMECTTTGHIDIKFDLKGTLDDEHQVLHMISSSRFIGGSSTSSCSNGSGGTAPIPAANNGASSMPWDIPAWVGVDHDISMPGQNPPLFTSSMKVRINKTD